VSKYKKGSAWKRANWDKWSLGKKIRHVIAVICSALAILVMLALFLYVVLVIFGIAGFIDKLRDAILLDFAHWIFD
jgi:hypothetical protein